jgi:hypothetical protein
MKISLYSIACLGIWYAGPVVDLETFEKCAKDCMSELFI